MAYIRKTRDLWDIQSNNGYGWESVNCEETRTDARRSLREYRENEPQHSHRLKKYREPITPKDEQ